MGPLQKKILKGILYTFLTTFISTLITLIFLPNILSTKVGTKMVARFLTSQVGKVSIDSLSLSWFGTQEINGWKNSTDEFIISIPHMSLEGLFSKPHLTIDDPVMELHYKVGDQPAESHAGVPAVPISNSLTINNGTFIVIPQDRSKPVARLEHIDLDLTPSTVTLTGKAKEGDMEVKANYTKKELIDIEGKFKNCPTKFLEIFPYTEHFPSLALGDRFTSTFFYKEGKCQFFLHSDLSDMIMNGKIEEGVFYLTRPLEVSCVVTPPLSQAIFELLSFRPVEVKSPIRLWISQEGASCPIKNFSIDKIEIKNGYFMMGQTQLLNAKVLSKLLGILKLKKRPDTDVPVWFQDSLFHMSKGILSIERTEFLVDNNYELTTWGNVDLLKDGGYLDMYVGLTAQALSKAFNVKSLPPNFVVAVGMKGPFDDIEIDKNSVAKQMAVVLGREQHPLGQLVPPDAASDGVKIPPPRKPFPWTTP